MEMESRVCSDIWVCTMDVYKIFQSLPIVCLKQTLKTLLKSVDERWSINNPNFEDDFENNPLVLEMIENYYEDPDHCYSDYYELIAQEVEYVASHFKSSVEMLQSVGFIAIIFPNSEATTLMNALEETVLSSQEMEYKPFNNT